MINVSVYAQDVFQALKSVNGALNPKPILRARGPTQASPACLRSAALFSNCYSPLAWGLSLRDNWCLWLWVIGIYWENGKENRNCYLGFGGLLRALGFVGYRTFGSRSRL